jgi:hypothetical protein
MEKINQFDFYELGKNFNALRREGDVNPRDVFFHLMMAIRSGVQLSVGKPIPLGVSLKQAEALLKSLRGIEEDVFYKTDEDGSKTFRFPDESDPPISEWKWSGMLKSLERFETVFREELAETATYYVPRKGIFSTAALVETADESFPAEVRSLIPEKTRVDWRAAGRCLALNLLTASGFHVARAVEGMLESYYQHFSGDPQSLSGEFLNHLNQM